MSSVLSQEMNTLSKLSYRVDLNGKKTDGDMFFARAYDDPEHNDGFSLNRVITDITTPQLTVFSPEKSNGVGILVIPGGGYQAVMFDKEGTALAPFFLSKGYTLFVLTYRLPSHDTNSGKDNSVNDAVQAFSLIKRNSAQWNLKKDRVGILGFSAGGHIAAAVVSHVSKYEQCERPDFLGLIYPVISMSDEITHPGSREKLLGSNPSTTIIKKYSIEHCVTKNFPPVFLLHCCDDLLVPVSNSLRMYQALLKEKIPAEMHLFESGGHGFGIQWCQGLPVRTWPDLFHNWLEN
ncbi:alpha/beta hydrolase [Escherichia coli O54:H45]